VFLQNLFYIFEILAYINPSHFPEITVSLYQRQSAAFMLNQTPKNPIFVIMSEQIFRVFIFIC